MRQKKHGAAIGNDLRSELFYSLNLDDGPIRLTVRPNFQMLARIEDLLGDPETGSLAGAARKLLDAPGTMIAQATAIILQESPELPDTLRADPDALLDAIIAEGPLNPIRGSSPFLLQAVALLHMGPEGLVDWDQFAPEAGEDGDEDGEGRDKAPLAARPVGGPSYTLRRIWDFMARHFGAA